MPSLRLLGLYKQFTMEAWQHTWLKITLGIGAGAVVENRLL